METEIKVGAVATLATLCEKAYCGMKAEQLSFRVSVEDAAELELRRAALEALFDQYSAVINSAEEGKLVATLGAALSKGQADAAALAGSSGFNGEIASWYGNIVGLVAIQEAMAAGDEDI